MRAMVRQCVQVCSLLIQCVTLSVEPLAGPQPKPMGCYGDGDGRGGSGPRLFPAAKLPDMPAKSATPAACAAACHKASPHLTLSYLLSLISILSQSYLILSCLILG
eukprot:SAG31_NODE_13807_length_845_cov_1.241287_2_plen_106_part_00